MGQDKIDITKLLADPYNVLLADESGGGGFFFFRREPGIYELHVNFLKRARGYRVIRLGMEAVRWMFMNTDCVEIHAKIPVFNKVAERAVRFCGGSLEAYRERAWTTGKGRCFNLSCFVLRFYDWARREREQHNGRVLLNLINEKLSSPLPGEIDLLCRLNMFSEMVKGDQPDKATILFNQWSRLAGLGWIAFIAKSPATFDFGSVLLQYSNNKFTAVAKWESAH